VKRRRSGSPRVLLRVRQRDIDEGRPSMCCTCPVALAVKRRFPEHHVEVGRTFVDLIRPGYQALKGPDRRYRLSERARSFINRYDAGEAVQPFVCTLTEVKTNAAE
jgi:hypothetical protein